MLNFSEIIETIKKLVELRVKITIHKVADDISTVITRIAVLVLMGLAGIFVLFFASMALAFFLGHLMDNTYLGFLSVGGMYLVLLLILYSMRNTLSLQGSLKHSLTKFIFVFKRKFY